MSYVIYVVSPIEFHYVSYVIYVVSPIEFHYVSHVIYVVPPVIRGGLIRGAAGQPEAIGSGASLGNVQLSGFSVAPGFR